MMITLHNHITKLSKALPELSEDHQREVRLQRAKAGPRKHNKNNKTIQQWTSSKHNKVNNTHNTT